jgi:hypothetical protein
LQNAHFLRHLYIKTIMLPRQARDKHRESTQKESCRHRHGQLQRRGGAVSHELQHRRCEVDDD